MRLPPRLPSLLALPLLLAACGAEPSSPATVPAPAPAASPSPASSSPASPASDGTVVLAVSGMT
ncbi:MAG: hypothetical protein L6R43_06190 [Planctomycetes bacterium]|nr:hypothetical protein [Planctomycetota bacterium]